MYMNFLVRYLALGLMFAVGLFAEACAAEQRVALVIGNSNYRSVAALPNPQRDAKAVAATLQKLGFETVITEQPAPYDTETLERFIGQVKPLVDRG